MYSQYYGTLTYVPCNHKIHRLSKLEWVDNTWVVLGQNQGAHPTSSKMDLSHPNRMMKGIGLDYKLVLVHLEVLRHTYKMRCNHRRNLVLHHILFLYADNGSLMSR